ncbi:MAG: FHA domain-containing protein [Ktedonobacteraceae bacterium]|jgi:pSer/pThr/pTyr-binding forkhead associated (FHA) protein
MAQEQIYTAYLVIEQGPQAGKRVEIWKDCTTIGRSRECDIFLEDISVHRKQASIIYTNAGYVLRDDHGSGDSIVNDKPVKEHLLNDGDRLLFGRTELTFFSHEATRPFQQPSSRGKELRRGKMPDPNASAIAKLDFTNIRGAAKSFELQPQVTIGRSRDCSIFLEDLAVSRLHATIRQLPNGTYELEDNQSATGTFVNGQPITRCLLKEGDIVQIGANKLTFRRSAF